MHIERCFVPGLANISYLVVSENEATGVDPERIVDGYRLILPTMDSNCGTFF
ncbi:MAG: hypothetical protein JOZ08_08570 [Verrucomicrobia bacterium]|nr:hypothetical protein [Verrucomicrobiota bacterium]